MSALFDIYSFKKNVMAETTISTKKKVINAFFILK